MSLLELCEGLESTLFQLERARRGAKDGDAIDQRAKQWNEKRSDLLSARQRAGWLQLDLSQLAPFTDQFTYTQSLAQEAAKQLEKGRDIKVLTEADLWVRLLQTAQQAAGSAWQEVKRAWKLKVEDFQQLTPTHQLRATASPLPQNDVLLAQYDAHYRTASRLAALETPKTASDPGAFDLAISNCKLLAGQLSFDAPKDVEEFFRAINTGGASLTLVTPIVLTWLADNDQLSKFTVRSSGR
jgi:hypothetical protein